MVDLARQAYSTKNFDLAAEIYERTLKESGPDLEAYLGLADSLARGGRVSQALEAFTQAFRIPSAAKTIGPDRLSHLVDALVSMMGEKEGIKAKQKARNEEDDIFACAICQALWNDPVTVDCGHTFCRKCLEKNQSRNCKKCGAQYSQEGSATLGTNVMLASLTQRWFPEEVQAVRLKGEGNNLFSQQKYGEAIDVYSRALGLAPKDHLIVSNRSNAYAAMDKYQEALRDAQKVIDLRPDWPKGYFRKGTALIGLCMYEEASSAFLQCLTLDPGASSARTSLAKALHKLLSPLSPEDLTHAELQSMLPPSLACSLGWENAVPLDMLGHGVDTLLRLKPSVGDPRITSGTLLDNRTAEHPKDMDQDTKCLMPGAANSEKLNRLFFTFPTMQSKSKKCHSAPNSSPSSPKLGRSNRSLSETALTIDDMAKLSRKRCHRNMPSEPTSPTTTKPRKQPRSNDEDVPFRIIPPEKLNLDDFECSLCIRTFVLPVTTPCGHVFCRPCLNRCLDHNNSCPLCKYSLAEFLAERRQNTTKSVELIMETYFPIEYAKRIRQYEEELADLAKMGGDGQSEIPVFVCTLAFPTVPCPLHVFEPRYRLMIRRCMESGARQFGMVSCLDENEASFSDYGCMLEIRDVQYFPDGRSVVDTVGGRRFKVISRGTRDGYNTARVEFLQDVQVAGAEAEELRQLETEVYTEAKDWFSMLPQAHQTRIVQHYGPYPDQGADAHHPLDGSTWVWWVIAVLPLDPRAQLSILAMTALKDRLTAIHRVLSYVKRRGHTQ